MMTLDHDNLPETIERLHEDAQALGLQARRSDDPAEVKRLRATATAKVRKAATLRAQMEAGA